MFPKNESVPSKEDQPIFGSAREWDSFRHSVKNIVIFISDSLRWDYRPEWVTKQGITFKTVVQSLYTAQSLPSIVTGLYPTKHQVISFQDAISSDVMGLLDIEGYHTSFNITTAWNTSEEASHLHRILRKEPGPTLEGIELPFLFIQHDMGGHCPYGFSLEEFGADCISFFREYGAKGLDKMRGKYQEGVFHSVDRFKLLIDILIKRNILGETLIIFTSDHGELLGEYGGLVGHGMPACPELVYVPTTFIHPNLPNFRERQGMILRSVDLYPTVAEILGVSVSQTCDGVSVFGNLDLPKVGYNRLSPNRTRNGASFKNKLRYLKGEYGVSSVWDGFGGHVFQGSSFLRNLVAAGFDVVINPRGLIPTYMKAAKSSLKDYWAALNACSRPYIQYGAPRFERSEAEQLINHIERQFFEVAREDVSPMSDEMRKKLEDLGYL